MTDNLAQTDPETEQTGRDVIREFLSSDLPFESYLENKKIRLHLSRLCARHRTQLRHAAETQQVIAKVFQDPHPEHEDDTDE